MLYLVLWPADIDLAHDKWSYVMGWRMPMKLLCEPLLPLGDLRYDQDLQL